MREYDYLDRYRDMGYRAANSNRFPPTSIVPSKGGKLGKEYKAWLEGYDEWLKERRDNGDVV